MRLIFDVGVNLTFVTLLYYGVIEEVEGARNAALALAWVTVILSPGIFLDAARRDVAARPPLHKTVSTCSDAVATVLLFWGGYWLLGGLYLAHAVAFAGARYSRPDLARSAPSNAPPAK